MRIISWVSAAVIVSCVGQQGVEPVPVLDALLVLPLSVTAAPGETAQLSAQRYRDGAVTDFTAKATWRSMDSAIATVDATGAVTAVKPGRTQMTGTAEGTSASVEVVVSAPALQLMPTSVHLHVKHLEDGGLEAESEALLARTWAADVATDVTGQTRFGSSDLTVGLVDDAGVVHAVGVGHATLTGLYEGQTATVELSVGEAHDE